MSGSRKRFAIRVKVRRPTLSSVIEGVYIIGGLAAERLAPRPVVLPLAIALITVYLLWAVPPTVILHRRRKRSESKAARGTA